MDQQFCYNHSNLKPMQKNDIHNLQIKTEQCQVQTEV